MWVDSGSYSFPSVGRKGMFPENKLLESSKLFRLLFPADHGYQSQPPTEPGLSCCHCAESIQHHRQLSSAPLMFMCIRERKLLLLVSSFSCFPLHTHRHSRDIGHLFLKMHTEVTLKLGGGRRAGHEKKKVLFCFVFLKKLHVWGCPYVDEIIRF